jgi:hypothetical protein
MLAKSNGKKLFFPPCAIVYREMPASIPIRQCGESHENEPSRDAVQFLQCRGHVGLGDVFETIGCHYAVKRGSGKWQRKYRTDSKSSGRQLIARFDGAWSDIDPVSVNPLLGKGSDEKSHAAANVEYGAAPANGLDLIGQHLRVFE